MPTYLLYLSSITFVSSIKVPVTSVFDNRMRSVFDCIFLTLTIIEASLTLLVKVLVFALLDKLAFDDKNRENV